MIGDVADMVARLQAVLPPRWFADVAPLRDAVLSGLGTAWSGVYQLCEAVKGQARIATATETFLDLISADFFETGLPRRPDESDAGFRLRIMQALLRPRATRAALSLALTQLTGRTPVIFEPSRPADTGGYGLGGVGYGVAGGWGNLGLPFQMFVTAFRPQGSGIAFLAGYGTGGIPVYGDVSLTLNAVPDAAIFAAAAEILPVASIAWMRIGD